MTKVSKNSELKSYLVDFWICLIHKIILWRIKMNKFTYTYIKMKAAYAHYVQEKNHIIYW